MSLEPPSLNDDLRRLQSDLYEVAIRHGQVVLTSIPYVTASREVKLGTIMTPLNSSAGVIGQPTTHQAWWHGEIPCDASGKRLECIYHGSGSRSYGEGLTSEHDFSAKGPEGQPTSYHTLFSTYIGHICPHAKVIDPSADPKTGIVVSSDADDSVFCYGDSNATRARIGGASAVFRGLRVGIVGCGGTGSYILDFVSKTPVAEIHLFDGDRLLQHNAFRSPGAASKETIAQRRQKVAYLADIYGAMHTGIRPHPVPVTSENPDLLAGMSWVFIAVDKPEQKQPIVEFCERHNLPFIDVGVGIEMTDQRLHGQIRTTASTPANRTTFRERVSLTPDDNGIYGSNIQIAEINAMNAAFAVIKWKKLIGYYHDHLGELHSVYSLNDHCLTKESGLDQDPPAPA